MHRAQHEDLVRSGGGSPPGAPAPFPDDACGRERPARDGPRLDALGRLARCDHGQSGVRCEVRARVPGRGESTVAETDTEPEQRQCRQPCAPPERSTAPYRVCPCLPKFPNGPDHSVSLPSSRRGPSIRLGVGTPARPRPGPTRHARRRFPARASRVRRARRSLVPPRGQRPSDTWLECEDPGCSRRLKDVSFRKLCGG